MELRVRAAVVTLAAIAVASGVLRDTGPQAAERPLIQSGRIDEVPTDATCTKLNGEFVSKRLSIPGDGLKHELLVEGPRGTTELLGGYAKAKIAELNNSVESTCTVNPPQPATPENSTQRRCSGDAQDMTVEICTAGSGESAHFACTFINSKGARTKTVELWSCWH